MMKQRKIFLIYGKTGSGKTTLAKKIINNYDRVVVIDEMLEYEGNICYDFNQSFNEMKKEKFFVVCRFNNDIDLQKLFYSLRYVKDLLLVVEESEIYLSSRTKKSSNDYFLYLVRYGRHFNISILGIARRVTELNIEFRSQVNEIYVSKFSEPKDLEIFEKIGISKEKILALKEYEFLKKTF